MKRIFIMAGMAIALTPLMSQPAFAWGHQGHETVGAIAALLIHGSNAEKQVQKILPAGESLSDAAEWADCAKGFSYCHVEPTAEMKDFVAHNPQHHAYHFSDIPFQTKAYPADGAVGVSSDDVVHILRDAILVLQGKPASNPNHKLSQREALYILAHMTGDIHQPLHVGAAYISSDNQFDVPKDQTDAKNSFTEGGNLMCKGSKNVHALWDDDLVVGAMRKAKVATTDALASALLSKAKLFAGDKGAVGSWPDKWATESLQLSSVELATIEVQRKRPSGAGQATCGTSDPQSKTSVWDVQLPDKYLEDGADTAANQLARAGARLAKTLTAIWP
jgi:hypothetical protein